jgi:4-hydroxybenzoate polyprenyltransferase
MSTTPIPLCVDLDGTLIRSDLLFESALALLRRNPLYFFSFVAWLMKGRAHLKRQIALRAQIDPSALPYDERVVEWLRTEDRPRVLCTASDAQLAQAVAAHVGVFDAVMASDGERNLAGRAKGDALRERYGERGFDYAGNERRDLAVWKYARRAVVVNAAASLPAAAAQECEVERVFERPAGGLKVWLKALRLHQWAKNLLVFLPILAGHRVFETQALVHSVVAFVAFGLCASGVYVLNDLFDLDADRRHPRKRLRPFAAGTLPLVHGLVAAPLLVVVAFALAFVAGPAFAGVLAIYYALTLAYSLHLKRVVMLDVVVLAALYTVRIIGGAAAIGGGLSFWLLAFSMFLFLSLAMLKRYTELAALQNGPTNKASGRGYTVDDVPLIQSLGGSSGYLSVLVLALYINSTASEALYHRPQILWLLCPLLLYWISRVWLVAHRGGMHDDPVVFALVDTVSRIVLVLCAIVVAGAI